MTGAAPTHSAKRLARLAAVQGLYQIALTQSTPKDVIKNFREHPGALLNETGAGEAAASVDQELFSNIITGVTQDTATLDEMIAGAFDAKLSADRIEVLLRAILRGGAYELHHHGSIASGVIINDYVDVAHAFFGAKEPGLVNAVLDKLGKNLRS
ncbi:MAG TPA: transcription antitermination factor NusB [Alphaproteobacteria bacterium]|nr:transcription antitermination factor NusB [Alphaproteobacteria bacterium]